MVDSKQKAQIEILQKHLSSIRKIAGWTAEELGNKIGVTKQTVSNLENQKTPMTLTQYIAIRAIIDYEIQTNKENTVLPQVITILLDQHETFNEEEREKISGHIKTLAASAAGGIGGAALAGLASTLIGSFIGLAPFVAGIATATWLSKLFKDKKK